VDAWQDGVTYIYREWGVLSVLAQCPAHGDSPRPGLLSCDPELSLFQKPPLPETHKVNQGKKPPCLETPTHQGLAHGPAGSTYMKTQGKLPILSYRSPHFHSPSQGPPTPWP
jgi:hypothetical protein